MALRQLFSCILIAANVSVKDSIILHSKDAGMFSVWMNVLALVHCYDRGRYHGIEVNFAKEGLYYDPEHGDNWWTYYCEPICYGTFERPRNIKGIPRFYGSIDQRLSREEAKDLIDRYIHLKPDILEKIAQFEEEHLTGHLVIAVHYRGTDKMVDEATPVKYETVKEEVDKIIALCGEEDYKIFIATDEQPFLDYMALNYGKLICFTNAIRSSNGAPLHIGQKSPYQHGLEAIIDMVLLSKGDILIRTISQLNSWSTFLNPDLTVIDLNKWTGIDTWIHYTWETTPSGSRELKSLQHVSPEGSWSITIFPQADFASEDPVDPKAVGEDERNSDEDDDEEVGERPLAGGGVVDGEAVGFWGNCRGDDGWISAKAIEDEEEA